MMSTIKQQSTLAQQLAVHFGKIDYSTLKPDDVATCKSLLLDYTGVALCGSSTESGRLAASLVSGKGGRPEATVIGTNSAVPAADAALANAISAHSLELDDVDREALFHFGPPVVSSALATAEAVKCSGRELVTALFCGCEMLERLSRAANPALRDRGFHTTAAAGVFGAAVASGKLLKLSEAELVCALGLAGAQAGGLMEMYGSSMQKRFNPGPAAANGITASRLAQLGFTGAETIFEGERGFLRAFAGGAGGTEHLRPETEKPYRLEVEFKAYACARPIHPAIDAVLCLRPKLHPRMPDIEGIRVYRHPMWANYHTNSRPGSYHEAQVSLPYSVAVALTEGDAFLDQYTKVQGLLAKVSHLLDKITIIPDDGLPTTVACRVEVLLPERKELVAQVDHPKGSIENPMTGEEREAKFTKLAGQVLPGGKVREIIHSVNHVEQMIDIQEFLKQLRF